MAGPAPKASAQRQRRNRTTTAATLEAGPATRVELPAFRVSAITCETCALASWQHVRRKFEELDLEPHDYEPRVLDWRQATRDWWEVIWASPMADEWVDADVPGLLALAVLWDDFWRTGDPKAHAEIRQAAREFGLSPLSRRQLQWEIKRLAVAPPARPQPGPSRAARRGTLSVLSGKAG